MPAVTSNLVLGLLLIVLMLTVALGRALRIVRTGAIAGVKPTAADAACGGDQHENDLGEGEAAEPPGSPRPNRLEYASDPQSIGAHLAIESGDLATHFHSAAKAIHAVHGNGGLPTIPARENAKLRRTEAEYIYRSTQAESITIKSGTRHPAFNVVHEIGHFIDHQALGSGGYGFASVEGYPAAKPVMDAVHASPEVKALKKETKRTKAGKAKRHLKYLGEPEELFARAYSQYIATRGRNSEFLSALRYEQKATYGKMAYWDEATFEPIAKLIDAMFREKGWSHG